MFFADAEFASGCRSCLATKSQGRSPLRARAPPVNPREAISAHALPRMALRPDRVRHATTSHLPLLLSQAPAATSCSSAGEVRDTRSTGVPGVTEARRGRRRDGPHARAPLLDARAGGRAAAPAHLDARRALFRAAARLAPRDTAHGAGCQLAPRTI